MTTIRNEILGAYNSSANPEFIHLFEVKDLPPPGKEQEMKVMGAETMEQALTLIEETVYNRLIFKVNGIFYAHFNKRLSSIFITTFRLVDKLWRAFEDYRITGTINTENCEHFFSHGIKEKCGLLHYQQSRHSEKYTLGEEPGTFELKLNFLQGCPCKGFKGNTFIFSINFATMEVTRIKDEDVGNRGPRSFNLGGPVIGNL